MRTFGIFSLACLSVIALMAWANPIRFLSQSGTSKPETYTELRTNIKQFIARKGIEATIARVEHSLNTKTIDMSECHSVLHVVGHAAYEFYRGNWDILTLPKSSLCLASYEHGIEAQIILDKRNYPSNVTPQLHEYCARLRQKHPGANCYHGAGHAFIQLYKDPIVAAQACEALTSDSPDDCYRGVFSEYRNYLKAYDGDNEVPIAGMTPAPIAPSHVYDWCLSLSSRYQKDCVTQFTDMIYDSNLDTSLPHCLLFDGWVKNVCIHIMSGGYALRYLPTLRVIQTPSIIVNESFEVKKSYIDGIIEGYHGFPDAIGLLSDAQRWCASFPSIEDKDYCTRSLK